MERIKAGANSRLMRLAQKMIVGGALLLDRVANSLHPAIRKRISASSDTAGTNDPAVRTISAQLSSRNL